MTFQVDVWDLGRIIHTRSFFHRGQAEEYADEWEAKRYLVGVSETADRPRRYCDKCQEPFLEDELVVYGIFRMCPPCKDQSRNGKRRIQHRLKWKRQERKAQRVLS
jgi:hypothetical protein